jgi:hypothetical protein
MPPELGTFPDCTGHPGVPGKAACQSCSRWACAVCATELGAGTYCPVCAGAQIPWERRSQLGFWRAYWGTLGPALFDSDRFFVRLRSSASLRGPISYALVSQYVGVSTLTVIYGAAALEGRVPDLPRTTPATLLSAVLLLFLLSGPVGVFSQALLALATHGLLRFLGAARGDLRITLRAVLYGGGATALNVTLIGTLLLIPQVWALLGTISAVKQAHQTTFWRAAGSVMVPTLAGLFLLLATAGAVQGWAGAS